MALSRLLPPGLSDRARRDAEKQLLRAEWLLYASNINSAQQEWEANNARVAWRYLDSCRPDFQIGPAAMRKSSFFAPNGCCTRATSTLPSRNGKPITLELHGAISTPAARTFRSGPPRCGKAASSRRMVAVREQHQLCPAGMGSQ